MESASPEPRERPLTFLGAALWTLAAGILIQLLISVVEAARPGAISDLVSVTTCQVLAHSVIFFAILRVHAPEASVGALLAVKRPPLLTLPLSLLAGASLAIPAAWVNEIVSKRFPVRDDEKELVERLYALDSPSRQAIVLVTVVLVVPICDELFFRGVLFTTLAKRARADVVMFATASYDALLGANPRAVGPILLLLVILGWMRARSGSVWPSLVARMAFFAVAVGPEILGRGEPPTRWPWLVGAALTTAAALLGIRVATRPKTTEP